ncbi:hypothetical protein [Actinoplanes sp. NPDC051859]|uniref:hypothetical protein n=1 Tax=Actinoplanes sp. NPDC051859 TaxID=3363909 RepID=UPI0037A056F9
MLDALCHVGDVYELGPIPARVMRTKPLEAEDLFAPPPNLPSPMRPLADQVQRIADAAGPDRLLVLATERSTAKIRSGRQAVIAALGEVESEQKLAGSYSQEVRLWTVAAPQ